MKIIGIYKYKESDYKELKEKLKQLNIELKPLKDGHVEDNIDLYVFNVDNPEEFNIKFDRPFIIISSLNNSIYLIKSLKLGALDYILKPFVDTELTVKRIQRLLRKDKEMNVKPDVWRVAQNDKLIDIEIKRAHRGKYPFALLLVKFSVQLSTEVLIKLIDKMKSILRESDSCLLYPDQNIIIMLPFADKSGTIVVARKIITLLNELGYKCYCLGAQYPEEGETREELINNLGKSIDSRVLYK